MATLSTEVKSKTLGELVTASSVAKTNYLTLWDGSSAKKATVEEVLKNVVEKSPYAHNAIYRGKSLGSTFTAAQSASIVNGTFDDIFIGDYWTINGVKYVVAGLDYFLNMGDTSLGKHHAVMIPETYMYTHCMNDENTTAGGYVGSKMYTEGLEQAKTTIKAAFGADHIVSHRVYLCNAVTDGKPSANAWFDSEVELMTEQMVYGSAVMQQMPSGGAHLPNQKCEKSQLPYFGFRNHIRTDFWLRDVASAAYFCLSGTDGHAAASGASNAYGVRPYFLIS